MSKLKVRDLMTTQLVTLQPTDTIKKAAIKLAVDNVSGAAVVDNRNHLLGIVSETDILGVVLKYQLDLEDDNSDSEMLTYSLDSSSEPDAMLKKISEEISSIEVSRIMTRTVLTTAPDATIIEVLRSMLELNVGRVPVVEKGVVIGIISRSDIIFAMYHKKV
ncbi:MAG: CBS domain-containing protein [Candidatus Methanomethylophilaceae archaeon]|nr:CBS domain-containing protein [Candidatus Methanomethylophilaceae archaeon]